MNYRDECQALWQTETPQTRWLKDRGWKLSYSNNPDWALLVFTCKSGNEWVATNPKQLLTTGSARLSLRDQWGRELGEYAEFIIPEA